MQSIWGSIVFCKFLWLWKKQRERCTINIVIECFTSRVVRFLFFFPLCLGEDEWSFSATLLVPRGGSCSFAPQRCTPLLSAVVAVVQGAFLVSLWASSTITLIFKCYFCMFSLLRSLFISVYSGFDLRYVVVKSLLGHEL